MRGLVLLGLLCAGTAAARSGGIEAQSCNGCHGTGTQQTSITLTPATFNPGDTLTVRVTLRGTGASGGLSLSTNGVGTFALVSGQNTRLLNGNVVHSSPKAAASGQVTFDARWTAPSVMGGVDFEVATVLANGNGASTGDQASDARSSQAFGCAGVTWFRDIDGDGVGSASSGTTRNCSPPLGFSANDGDCDDFDNRRTPGKTESCNALDDDCNTLVDEGLTSITTWPDADGDGYGWAQGAPMSGCAGGSRAQNALDCDDANRTTNPGAMEICNQRDDDCDGQADEGARVRCGQGWCERLGPTCNAADCTPGAPLLERCNALDDDCDGVVDDGDLCGAGAACVSGKCVEGAVDAGAADAGPSSPRGESTGCASAPGLLIALALIWARRACLPLPARAGRGKQFQKRRGLPTPRGMTSRLLLFGAMAAWLSACEPWRCDASTCINGCCDPTGTCIVSGGTSKCGLGGAACASCATCTQGVCGCNPGLAMVGGRCTCSATSCASGCCQTDYKGDPECVQSSSQSSSRCGTRGATCGSCSYPSTCGSTGCTSCDSYGDSCTSGSCCSSYYCQYNSNSGGYRCGY